MVGTLIVEEGRFIVTLEFIQILWSPDTTRRRRGSSRRRWQDELGGTNDQWNTLAMDRKTWKSWGEAFAQQWDDTG